MIKKILSGMATLLLFVGFSFGQKDGQTITPGNCLNYQVEGNKVIFSCENDVKVRLSLVDEGIIRVWYDRDDFIRNNESFAVVRNTDQGPDINISEQPNRYEIYTAHLILRIRKSPFQIRVFDKYQKMLMKDYQDKGFVADSTRNASYKTLKSGERIYGLGEKNGPLNRTGETFKMWNSDKPCYGVNEDPLYKSIPFFMSSNGYGIYFDNTYKTEYDFGSENENYYSFSTPGGEMDFYFIYGPSYKQIISRYMDLTGDPIMPPAWGLTFSQCRGLLTNEELTRKIAREYREREIPCDIIYQDIGWTQHLQDFEWKDENYSNPEDMVSDLADKGFKVVVSQDPVISQRNKSQWKEADSLGYFATDVRTGKSYDMPWPWGGNCGVVDFTKPEVADWWGRYQQKVLDDGVKGFWTDMGEPAWSNEEDTDRLYMKHHLGMHEEIHNVYGLTWDKIVTEQFEKRNPNQRIFQMTRAGFAGMQRYTFGWSGDAGNGHDVTEGWDKLAAQIPIALSAGMGGIPFWSCDISGYCGDIEDYEAMSELYVRWMQFGVFNPISRAHHEGNNAVEPWLFGEEAEKINKQAIELKYRLFPYIYSYARETYDTGLPLMRALMLEYPDDAEAFNLDSQYLFGEELLVAPVVEEGAASKKVYLPQGTWIDFSNPNQKYEGEQWIDYPVELETIPLFVKQGSVIPTMPVMQYIGENPDYPLIFNIYPASPNKKAEFEVYEDDGETNDYKRDIFLKRNIECKTTRKDYQISYSEETSNGYVADKRNRVYKLYLEEKPSQVRLGGKKLRKLSGKQKEILPEKSFGKAGWSWNEEKGICLIKAPGKTEKENIVIRK